MGTAMGKFNERRKGVRETGQKEGEAIVILENGRKNKAPSFTKTFIGGTKALVSPALGKGECAGRGDRLD